MDIKKDKKTFNYLSGLFIEIGEKRLNRKLSLEEIKQIKAVIGKKCQNIQKKDIVKQIYNLELAKLEKRKGPTSFKEKQNLKKHVYQMTGSTVKTRYSSSSDALTQAVANEFTNIHMQHTFNQKPYLRSKPRQEIQEDKKTLRASYANTFSYTAPKSLADKIRISIALGLVGASAVSIIGYEKLFQNQPTTITGDLSISDSSKTKTYTPQTYVESQLKTTTDLEHFKSVVAQEYNRYHFMEEVEPNEITVLSNSHDFFFRVTSSDYEYYIAPGDSPEEVEKILKTVYSNVDKIQNENSNINIITVSDKNSNFLGGSAFFNNRYIPIITDGNNIMDNLENFYRSPSTILSRENNEQVANFITKLCASHCFDALLVDSYNYAECMADFVTKNPDNAYSREVMHVVKDPLYYVRYNLDQFSQEEILKNYRAIEARENELNF